MRNYIREPINSLTHFIGAILSCIALIAMIIKVSFTDSSSMELTAVIIFGISMILLYTTSATYHMVISSESVLNFLQRLDHSMIFILIVGSYSPFCLIALNKKLGFTLFSVVTVCALIGVIFKMAWFKCPRMLSTTIYIVMGWLAIFVFKPLLLTLSGNGLFLLICGGLLDTFGGLIYAFKPKFPLFKHWGFHEIFHLFIMMGSLYHFLCIYFYVL